MATNTAANIGVRRMIYSLPTPEHRNFEPTGQLYKVMSGHYEYQGTVYNSGDTIPYDGAGVYTDVAQLERDFNSGLLDPAS